MSVGDVLLAISEAGLMLEASETEDTLKVYPPKNITPELAEAIREHKAEIIQILHEDEEMRRTGNIQSERQVFEKASEYFDYEPTKREEQHEGRVVPNLEPRRGPRPRPRELLLRRQGATLRGGPRGFRRGG